MRRYARGWLSFGILWISIIGGSALASCEPWIAKIVSTQGNVETKPQSGTIWSRARLHDTFCAGDSIRADIHSRAGLLLHNQTLLALDQGTTLVLPELKVEQSAWLELLRGAVHLLSNVPYRLNIKTPFVNAAIEGTEFAIRVSEKDTKVWVLEGKVRVENPRGTIILNPGQAAIAELAKAPAPYLTVKPRDAVQWALYYPPIIDYRPEVASNPIQQQAMTLYRAGKVPGAIGTLNTIPGDERDTQFHTLRAALLLSVGQVHSALEDIERANELKADNGSAFALRSIVSLVQNDKDEALELAQKAANLDPNSPTPQIALSYVYQAAFDIEAARDSLKKALELVPDDPLAWARLSELELSRGEVDDALEAAQKAEALDPGISRTQMVLGFAHLMQINIDEAMEAFNKAIELDPAAPLPRLGLGLAKIRQGDVEEGRKDIEVAAILDPANSLIRSYLGKAYYEEKRGNVASREFARAKQLDPKDPTPWFYDAIHKQTVNRPVEALHDMQKAIELNDNRAVYRSRLLLDDDLAARSASLGRIYNDLGFQQLGLVEGWKSVNTDPSNYSAHRLLADNYAALPRHEIARVSELLQSQLLQPINITPVQPQLAESDLLILNGLGPADPSFNEFNPLFARNRLALQVSGVVGTNDSYGDEVTQSGLWNKFSYSLGQFHFRTDGFRENNDQKQDIYSAFVQASLSPKLSVQAEYRRTESKQGDRQLRFDPKNFSSNLQESEAADFVRFGLRYQLSPSSLVLGSFSYRNFRTLSNDSSFVQIPPIPTPFGSLGPFEFPSTMSIDSRERGILAELQYIFRTQEFSAVGGIGHFDSDDKLSVSTMVDTSSFIPNLIEPIDITVHPDIRHTNIYSYFNLRYLSSLNVTLGLSADFFRQKLAGAERNQVNPKFGIIWNATEHTVARFAAFRTLKRALLSNQTIEPTQVAGFNQFFDDLNGTEAWRYGIAVDHKLSPKLSAGFELTARDLQVSTPDTVHWDERQVRGYLFWVPWSELALNISSDYERLDRKNNQFNGISKLRTLKIPMGLSFFHPSGFIFQTTTTYVDQSGSFITGSISEDDDQFWTVDASIKYRLPKRYGILSFAIKNLFDRNFNFQQETDPTKATRPQFVPERLYIGRLVLSF